MKRETDPGEKPLLDVRHLKKYFNINAGGLHTRTLKAVDDISFSIRKGETLGLVGESGCGKTTAGRSILHLYQPTGGEVEFGGRLIRSKDDIRELHRKTAMVFQDPYSSLDPRMTVSDIIGEPLDIHKMYGSKQDRKDRILDLMERVGLSREHASRYAHEFSGGQRQRIGIARALALRPEFIVCDEPVSALDVSVRAQIINMFAELQEQMGLTYLFIAHDILVVRHISDRIAVMYLGRIVETGDSADVCDKPLHPYTRALMSALPQPDPILSRANKRIVLSGDIPGPLNIPSGCPFRTRCPYAAPQCREQMPELKEVEKGRFAACHRFNEI
ncbi:MAG: ABC transporter ATP-binding protein [Lachnospiraceae bacterium]|nr:ABC transporter ATP-binding protein [Lachnospiraceae bacterium]